MCGIAGFAGLAGSEENRRGILARMCGLIRHRGPDDEGFYVDPVAALGHRRLSIIDLSGGKQPMSNAEGTVWTVFNGEIYNFPELRAELESKGYAFRTRSDTEVLIHGYSAWGPKLMERLNGMFAFAIWDVRARKLLLARDRLGKKPVYYREAAGGIAFASELKALLADPSVPREVDPAATDKFFTFGYIPAPDTILKGVRKLRPGHYLAWDAQGGATVSQYWDVRYAPDSPARREEDYVDELEAILTGAVKRRMISDVPLGAFLSGGLDSSVVVGLMSRLSGSRVKTFTIDFEDKRYSEVEDARRVANAFGTDHKEFTVTPDTLDILPDLVWHLDEPFGDSSAIPTHYVSRMARREVTVVLSGDGGDEMFAGYHSHGLRGRYDGYRHLPKPLRAALGPLGRMLPVHAPARSLLLGIAELEKYRGGETVSLYPLVKDRVYSRAFAERLRECEDPLSAYAYWRNVPQGSRLSRLQYLDTKVYLPEDILMKVDKMSMANSLETRAPLLDYTVAEFAARIPPGLQRKDGKGKYLLRKLAARFLPPEALSKRKQGFAIPREKWFQSELKAWVAELFASERFRQRGYFRPEVADRMLAEHARGSKDFSYWIWCLINFELWHRTFVDPDTRRI